MTDMKKIKKSLILNQENYRKIIDEEVKRQEKNNGMAKGWLIVKDKKTGEILNDKSNLILWCGREILLQKLTMINRDSNDPVDYKNLGLFWVSFGTDESDPADILAPIAPNASDTGLVNEIVIDSGNPNLADGGKKLPLVAPTYEQDSNNGNSWLIAKYEFTLEANMANNNDINAACMWLSDSQDPTQASVFKAFSKITFSTIRKEDTRELDFIWFFYF